MKYILAIDQGTSSTKAILFDANGVVVARGVAILESAHFENGFVEQDPEGIVQNVFESVGQCLDLFAAKGGDVKSIVALGISNQRETFVLWDQDGKPLYPAVVWQCKRSIEICNALIENGLQDQVKSRTGLLIDPYFSGTKVAWLHQNQKKVREAIQGGNAYFGTIDTWLLYKFTNGKSYLTDHTNASRTMFMNLSSLEWDNEMLDLLGLSKLKLPVIQPSGADYGTTDLGGLLPQAIPVAAMIGDSHAAAFGECCFQPGTAKATLGTGCSLLMNIGSNRGDSANGMVDTICWSKGNEVHYAMEGVIVSCGSTLEWIKNELALFVDSRDTDKMANAVADNGGVYLIPAFSGLGAPHWDMKLKASIQGMTFGTTRNHIVRAALESIVYQIKDVVVAMEKDTGVDLSELMVDGGITQNEFVMQWLAAVLGKKVKKIAHPDVSALGAAMMAGWQIGLYQDCKQLETMQSEKSEYNSATHHLSAQGYEEWMKLVHKKN